MLVDLLPQVDGSLIHSYRDIAGRLAGRCRDKLLFKRPANLPATSRQPPGDLQQRLYVPRG